MFLHNNYTAMYYRESRYIAIRYCKFTISNILKIFGTLKALTTLPLPQYKNPPLLIILHQKVEASLYVNKKFIEISL